MYVRDVILRVMNGVLPSAEDQFEFKTFQTCMLNVIQWSSVARTDELLNLHVEDLVFPGVLCSICVDRISVSNL